MQQQKQIDAASRSTTTLTFTPRWALARPPDFGTCRIPGSGLENIERLERDMASKIPRRQRDTINLARPAMAIKRVPGRLVANHDESTTRGFSPAMFSWSKTCSSDRATSMVPSSRPDRVRFPIPGSETRISPRADGLADHSRSMIWHWARRPRKDLAVRQQLPSGPLARTRHLACRNRASLQRNPSDPQNYEQPRRIDRLLNLKPLVPKKENEPTKPRRFLAKGRLRTHDHARRHWPDGRCPGLGRARRIRRAEPNRAPSCDAAAWWSAAVGIRGRRPARRTRRAR